MTKAQIQMTKNKTMTNVKAQITKFRAYNEHACARPRWGKVK